MYSYGGSLYKKNGSLKSQLSHKPTIELTSEETYNNPHINKNITNQYTSILKEFENEPTRRLLDLDESIKINKQQSKVTYKQSDNFRFFTCKYCNFNIQDWQAYKITKDEVDDNTLHDKCYYDFKFKFCPNCGKEVVSEKE